MKLLRPLVGYTLYDHKTNDYIRRELQITRHTRQDRWMQTELVSTLAKNATKPNPLWNHTTTDHKEGEQLEDRRKVGESSCNFGDGTDQRVLDVYDDDSSLSLQAEEQCHFMRTALFWAITQRVVVIPYRRFGTTYRSHLQRSRIWILDVGNELPLHAA